MKVFRYGKKIASFDIYKYFIEGKNSGNISLQNQDLIVVNPYKKLVKVAGAVKRKGIYQVLQDENFNDLKEYFGGFSAKAYKKRFSLIRFTGTEKTVKDVGIANLKSFSLVDGDYIYVSEISNRYKNRLVISGAVNRPGHYAFEKGTTLKMLLQKSDGLKKEAFLERGIIFREIDEHDKEALDFDPYKVWQGSVNIPLRSNDSVYIYARQKLREKRYVKINGAVMKDGTTIDFVEHLTPQDVIAMAGGFKEGAEPLKIEVVRRLNNFQKSGKNNKVIKLSLQDLKITKNPFYLKPFDIVSVRYKEGYDHIKNIFIEGQVRYPGEYIIENKNEKIADLIKKAGGCNQYADLNSATLYRYDKKSKQYERMGINLPKILKNPKKEDILLKEGDKLFIPEFSNEIKVKGEVNLSGLVRYHPGFSFVDYIKAAGGTTEKSNRNKSYILYANGNIKVVHSFLFFKFYPKVEPGATIVVPKKGTKQKKRSISITELVTISTSVTTLALLVKQLYDK